MNGFSIIILAPVVLISAYMIYGRYLVKKWGIDPDAKMPVYTEEDGVDYVPADTNVVFGHQFASIAGAALDFNRRCVLWCGTGLCCHVRISKK